METRSELALRIVTVAVPNNKKERAMKNPKDIEHENTARPDAAHDRETDPAAGTKPFAGNEDGGTEPHGDAERERDFDDEQSADTGAVPEWSEDHPEG